MEPAFLLTAARAEFQADDHSQLAAEDSRVRRVLRPVLSTAGCRTAAFILTELAFMKAVLLCGAVKTPETLQ